MLHAALTSAFWLCPHRVHTNTDWLLRLAGSTWPQAEQVREVLRGSAHSTHRPASSRDDA